MLCGYAAIRILQRGFGELGFCHFKPKEYFITSGNFLHNMNVVEKQSVHDAGQTRPVRNVISYLQSLDGSSHTALDTINNGVIFDAASSVYIVEPPM
jgi:hypothetical protein